MAAHLHFAEQALPLHLLLQHFEGLIDIVVTDEDLHAAFLLDRAVGRTDRQAARASDARLEPDLLIAGRRRDRSRISKPTSLSKSISHLRTRPKKRRFLHRRLAGRFLNGPIVGL
jgi:hypothetical protein